MISMPYIRRKSGFTVVELTVVIVVIGILATIVTVAYNGVQRNAYDKGVRSDLEGLAALETQYALKTGTGGKNWYSGNGVDSDLKFSPSSDNVIDVVTDAKNYCIRGYNTKGNKNSISNAFIRESSPGVCDSLLASGPARGVNGNQVLTGTVATVAGSNYGYVDGQGSAAKFQGITGIAVDKSGSVLAAEGNRIRKVSQPGAVTTLATLPSQVLDVAVSPSGDIFATVPDGHAIYKIASNGTFNRYTNGIYGIADGTLSTASFLAPGSLTFDSVGNMYVTDVYNIRKITPAGQVTTFAGGQEPGYVNATGTAARFGTLMSTGGRLATDASNNLFLADGDNGRVRKISPSAQVTTFVGSGLTNNGNGTGSGASVNLDSPKAIAINTAGVMYLSSGPQILKVTSAGAVTLLAGQSSGGSTSTDGTGTAARFASPGGLALDSAGVLYVGDSYYDASRVRRVE